MIIRNEDGYAVLDDGEDPATFGPSDPYEDADLFDAYEGE